MANKKKKGWYCPRHGHNVTKPDCTLYCPTLWSESCMLFLNNCPEVENLYVWKSKAERKKKDII